MAFSGVSWFEAQKRGGFSGAMSRVLPLKATFFENACL
jgi:hypothetical protein